MEGSILDAMQKEQLKAVIWPLVDSLPGKQPAVIRMRYQEGLTLKECGERLGIALQGARTHESNALRGLRQKRRFLLPFLDGYIYSRATQGNGAGTFARTWTSSTERVALNLVKR